MKTSSKNGLGVVVLVASVACGLPGLSRGQSFATLQSFIGGTGGSTITSRGSRLAIQGNTLYGSSGARTLFRLNTDGTGYEVLLDFGDGFGPHGRLTIVGDTLFGAASAGGIANQGTVFKIGTDGTGFAIVHDFADGSNGAMPSGLLLWGNALYGTALFGGAWQNGTVFAVNTDGTGFTTLHSFSATFGPGNGTNSDGALPQSGLILVGNTLYGACAHGGSSGNGTLFKINTDGSGFGVLHRFGPSSSSVFTNTDGVAPNGELTLVGNRLYGTAQDGGQNEAGTVFALNVDGTGFTTLHEFTGAFCVGNNCRNSDGISPSSGLVLSGDSFYGTATGGGSWGGGTLFGLNTDGTGFTNLHSFGALAGSVFLETGYTNSDGAVPAASLILWGNNAYGITEMGGAGGFGTVFSFSLLPQITVVGSGTNVSLAWPAVLGGGFTLQSSTNLGPNAVWTPVSQGVSTGGGARVITDPIGRPREFYRLTRP